MKALSLLVGLAFAPALFAQTPTADPAPAPVVANAEAVVEPSLHERTCIRYTGSRLTQSRNEHAEAEVRRTRTERNLRPRPPCAPVAGRAYTREEIDRMGAFGLVDALRMLDPSVN